MLKDKYRKYGSAERRRYTSPTVFPKIKADYENLMSMAQIGKKYGLCRMTISRIIKRLGMKSREKREAQRLYINRKGHQRLGKHQIRASRKKISNSMKTMHKNRTGEIPYKEPRKPIVEEKLHEKG